jgi:hypothetical protein
MRQCDAIRRLVAKLGFNRSAVIDALAQGLADGSIRWKRNSHGLKPDEYANMLYRNWVDRDLL